MQFIQLVKKDLVSFASDRKAMMISFLVPILIASFLGSIFGNVSSGTVANKIKVLVVDQDQSPVTKKILAMLQKSETVTPEVATLAKAQADTKTGAVGTAIVFQKGFGESATAAMSGGAKPVLTFLTDPSKGVETQAAKGGSMSAIMQGITQSVFGASAATQDLPFTMHDEPQTGGGDIKWVGSAHAFAGMGVQALLFGAIEAAMGMLRDRRNGLWSRLRASPVSPWMLLAARFMGSALVSCIIFLGVFAFGALVFHYRITGSYIGFFLIAFSTAAMAAGLGLFIAALGRTEQQSRGLSVLVVLGMLMLGGAWMPSFIMPGWVQTLSLATPVRWAVDGVDGMTFRGDTLAQAPVHVAVLLAFGVGLALIAGKRFRWEPEAAA